MLAESEQNIDIQSGKGYWTKAKRRSAEKGAFPPPLTQFTEQQPRQAVALQK